jgi:hypothetical protein
MAPSSPRVVLRSLIGLALALLLVGVVSRTILRHIVQILPIVVAAGVLMRRPALGAYAALPIFAFWIFIVVLIWLFLLGLSQIANGTYSPTEILLTFVMAACSVLGISNSFPLGKSLRIGRRVSITALFAIVQVAAMWVSFLKPIATN